jgi:hypothetical protein
VTKVCAIDGCDNPIVNKGLCNKHHLRLKRYGDPLGHGSGVKRKVTHPLAEKLQQLSMDTGLKLKDLTVLSDDPYRLDVPSNHRDGQWFRERMEACGLIRPDGSFPRQIHNRGIHYAIFMKGSVRPDIGSPYLNDDPTWRFLGDASQAARWLGYVPFDVIEDARNSAPVTKLREGRDNPNPVPFAGVHGFDPTALEEIKNIDLSLSPYVIADFAVPSQPYRLVFWGEKTSLQAVLEPIAEHYHADLYLTAGEPSDTVLHTMAKTGAEDGREMVVFTFSDSDPAGYQMPVSISHKLRAFRDLLFSNLRFRVVTACLTIEQVRELGLPSTPLKETEKRDWRAKYGVDQTEIDALATLRPDTFRQIVHDAVRSYFDSTLVKRVNDAGWAWKEKADPIFEETLAEVGFYAVQEAAEEEIGELGSNLIATINERITSLRSKVHELLPDYEGCFIGKTGTLSSKLPPIEIPQPELDEPPEPFVSSDMDLSDAIRVLRDRKNYT